ncbi:IS3 family transposase [Pyramidobacter porci]
MQIISHLKCKLPPAQLENVIWEYVQFYNYERINMKNGLTPFEIRSKAK